MSQGKVFVVDDDPDVRGALADVLDLYGYEVDTAANGQEALDLLGAGYQPDLIFLDLSMPVMTGQQLLQSLSAPRPPPRVVVVTAVREAIGAEVDHVLSKPFEIEAILEVAARFCPSTRA